MRILEIGVAEGRNAERLLQAVPNSTYLGIDPWALNPGLEHEPAKVKNWNTQKHWDTVYLSAWERLLPYRATLLRGLSADLLPLLKVAGHRFDYIVVDGDHSRAGCLTDLRLSAPLITPGGRIFLDDLHYPTVRSALDEFLASSDFTIDGNTLTRPSS